MALTPEQIDAAYRVVWTTVPHRNRLSAFAHHIAAEARRDALEAAAKVILETKEWKNGKWTSTICPTTADAIAAAIRKLKEDIQ